MLIFNHRYYNNNLLFFILLTYKLWCQFIHKPRCLLMLPETCCFLTTFGGTRTLLSSSPSSLCLNLLLLFFVILQILEMFSIKLNFLFTCIRCYTLERSPRSIFRVLTTTNHIYFYWWQNYFCGSTIGLVFK